MVSLADAHLFQCIAMAIHVGSTLSVSKNDYQTLSLENRLTVVMTFIDLLKQTVQNKFSKAYLPRLLSSNGSRS